MFKSTDPDSMRGKLLLLLVDKLFIGAILATAFVIYDSWKTTQTDEYNRFVQNAQHDFKRTEFTSELLPLVLDKNQDINIRMEILGSLIRTESIEPSSATRIAILLLEQGALANMHERFHFQERVNAYTQVLARVVPKVLPSFISTYRNYTMWRTKSDIPSGFREVLVSMFEYAWRNFPDEKLRFLDEKAFVGDNLQVLSSIVPEAHIHYTLWTETTLLALRVLRDIEILKNKDSEESAVVAAATRLEKLMNYTGENADDTGLSASILGTLPTDAIPTTTLIDAAYNIILNHDELESSELAERWRIGEYMAGRSVHGFQNPFSSQYFAAERFLIWSAFRSRDAEKVAYPVVREFLGYLEANDLDALKYPEVRRYHRTAVCVLVGSMIGADSENPYGESAEHLIRMLASLPEEKLGKAHVAFLIDRFTYPVSEWVEEDSCGLDFYE